MTHNEPRSRPHFSHSRRSMSGPDDAEGCLSLECWIIDDRQRELVINGLSRFLRRDLAVTTSWPSAGSSLAAHPTLLNSPTGPRALHSGHPIINHGPAGSPSEGATRWGRPTLALAALWRGFSLACRLNAVHRPLQLEAKSFPIQGLYRLHTRLHPLSTSWLFHREFVAHSPHLSGITLTGESCRVVKIISANLCASLGTGRTPS